ncbi:uncharacterized protein [Amphiura filiformis]|uniref:uncharacterized protein n=1 Tax=Amphiura filiformis TaxID=82378 RepID=UPI003B21B35F
MEASTNDTAYMVNAVQGSMFNHMSHDRNQSKTNTTLNHKQLDKSSMVYGCKRCPGMTFTTTGKLAIHYNELHPGNERELQSQINKPCRTAPPPQLHKEDQQFYSKTSRRKLGTDDLLPAPYVVAECEPKSQRTVGSKRNSPVATIGQAPASSPLEPASTCGTPTSNDSSPAMTNGSGRPVKHKLQSPVQTSPFIDEKHQSTGNIDGQKRRKVHGFSQHSTCEDSCHPDGTRDTNLKLTLKRQVRTNNNQACLTKPTWCIVQPTVDCRSGTGNLLSERQDDRNINSASSMVGAPQTEIINRDNEYHVNGDQTTVKGHQFKISGPVTIHARDLQESLMIVNGGTAPTSTSKVPNGNAEVAKSTPQYISVSPEVVANAGLPPVQYNGLLCDVDDSLTPKQFKKMKRLLLQDTTSKLGIPRNAIEDIDDKWVLLKCMEKFNYLSSSNTWFLQYLMYVVGNRKLYKLVFNYKTEQLVSASALYVYEPSDIQGARKSKVKLKVTGDIKQFKPIKVDQFQQLLSKQCGSDIEYVCPIGVKEGCVYLYFQVPSVCKQHFCSSSQLYEWCRENGIMLVCFDGDEIINIPTSEATRPTKYDESGNTIVDVLKNDENKIRQQTSFQTDLKIGGKSLLHLATELNYHNIVKHLIAHGAKLDEVDQMRATPLHMAVFLDHSHICRTLLKHPNIDVNATDKFGNTALHIATCQGDHHLCTLLIEHGASTDIVNQDGKTSLDLAKDNNFPFLLLLTGDAKVDDLMVAVDEHTLCCAICYCSFKKPQILPCGHNFCSNCLETQWRTSSQKEYIECSICKQKAAVPDDDITELMSNKPLFQQVEEARHIQKWEKQNIKPIKEFTAFMTDPKDGTSADSSLDACREEIKNEATQIEESTSLITDPEDDTSEDSSEDSRLGVSRKKLGEEATEPKGFEDVLPAKAIKQKSEDSSVDVTRKEMLTPRKTHEEAFSGRVLHLTKVTRNSLTCRLCHERFKKPVRKLHCSHSFCEGCLKAVVMKSYLTCPTCDLRDTHFREGCC